MTSTSAFGNWVNRGNGRRRFGTIATPPTEEEVEERYENMVKVVQSNGVHKEEFVEEHKSTHHGLSDENSKCDVVAVHVHTISTPVFSSLLSPSNKPLPNTSSTDEADTSSQIHIHDPYRNVGSDRLHELPAEDASAAAKREVREKGVLGYGGVDRDGM